MGVLHIMRQSYLDSLKSNIRGNIENGLYERNDPWLSEFFGREDWHLIANVSWDGSMNLEMPKDTDLCDFENTKIVYSALKGLTPAQAADERLWAYLTHTTFWSYMRRRWPVERALKEKNPADIVRERYFFMSNRNRALVRNGIARLWWYGYMSYDDTRKDPFELTAVLLRDLDYAQNLLERSFSNNRNITLATLSALKEREKNGKRLPSRKEFRMLMKHLIRLGGVVLLDVLDREELERTVSDTLNRFSGSRG